MNKRKVFWLSLLTVAVIAGSYFLYQSLTEKYDQFTNSESIPQADVSGNHEDSQQGGSGENQALMAPDFTIYDAEGNPVTLSQYQGKGVVINFWASWCGWCEIEMPSFQTAYEKYGEDVQFLMINLTGGGNDTQEKAEEMIESGGYTFPVFYDHDLSAAVAYAARSIPVSYFINAKGELVAKNSGPVSDEKLENYIDMIR